MQIDYSRLPGHMQNGIREWIKWLKGIPENVQINYENCPRIFVDQMNMVEGFLPPRAKVASFQLPYYCEECDSETNVLMARDKDFSKAKPTPKGMPKCQSCGKDAEIDVVEQKYFRFLGL